MTTKHQPILSAPVAQIRRKGFALALGGFLFTSIFALSAPSAEAQCKRWDVTGNWVIQKDNGINENVSLQQGNWELQSANLTGTAAVSVTAASNSSFTKPQYAGVISGNVTDNSFSLKITRDTAQYRYTGKIYPSGKIEGTDNIGVHWVGSRRMKCADAKPVSKPATGGSSDTVRFDAWHPQKKGGGATGSGGAASQGGPGGQGG